MSAEDEKVRRQAAEDLSDISELQRSQGFNRYWLRRLRQKRDAVDRQMKYDPPEKCSKDEREVLRRISLAYEELLALPANDEGAAKRLLGN